ncbi:MAG: NADP-dependent isocitrate dehydrogenase [Treponema sp.]|jgi:isocitrate dehydrogenase|nr:NADP-dependent isocitrate dehydrogenase [Treponema sp.]
MERIAMRNPIVEMDGDEMTRVLWKEIKEKLLFPFVELNTEYYDLGLPNRDGTNDEVTLEAANAIKKHAVGVKCATITPNAQRMEEYALTKMWKSPNATIRGILDGTVFRAPIVTKRIEPVVRGWKKPITIARHAYGDVYTNTELRVESPGSAELLFADKNGEEKRLNIFDFEGKGVLQGQYNTDKSISSFARACFEYAISVKQDLWFSAKDTISKQYDHTFKSLFQSIFDSEYKARFDELNIKYFYTLIDDAVARVMRSEGGFVWACKNYDGDVMSDMISSAFGSLAMMTSVLVSPDGNFEYEAAHGTITHHYYRYLKGETTSSNPVATIFAWSGALRKRGELDSNAALVHFANALETACVATIEDGFITGDLAPLCKGEGVKTVDYVNFISSVAERLAPCA